jgi:hypothetical protein
MSQRRRDRRGDRADRRTPPGARNLSSGARSVASAMAHHRYRSAAGSARFDGHLAPSGSRQAFAVRPRRHVGPRVHWARQFSQREIDQNRARDRLLLGTEDWFQDQDAHSDWLDTTRDRARGTERRVGWWYRLRRWLRRRNRPLPGRQNRSGRVLALRRRFM